jgi:hypothetical protein
MSRFLARLLRTFYYWCRERVSVLGLKASISMGSAYYCPFEKMLSLCWWIVTLDLNSSLSRSF